jgi:RNase P/RNase MRP subunit p29
MRPKKRPWRASGVGCERGSGDLALEVEQNTFEIVLIKDLLLLGNPQEQGIAAEVVDFASNALGVVVDATEEAVAKELSLVARDAHVMLDVPSGFFQVEGSEVVADGDALVEGFVGSEAELVGQVGLAEEDEGDQRSRIHLVVEQEAQLVKEFRGQEVRFVDDEQDVAALAGQVVKGGAELREEAHKAESGFYLESKENLPIEGRDAQVWVREIDDGVEIVVEGLGKGADGSRFSSTNIAGEESREALLEGKGQAALDLAVATGSVEVLAIDRFG